MTSEWLLVVVNFLACSYVGFACLCRLNKMHGDLTRTSYRWAMSLLLVASTSQGFSGVLWGSAPTISGVFLAVAIAGFMRLTMGVWRLGAPPCTIAGNADPCRRVGSSQVVVFQRPPVKSHPPHMRPSTTIRSGTGIDSRLEDHTA